MTIGLENVRSTGFPWEKVKSAKYFLFLFNLKNLKGNIVGTKEAHEKNFKVTSSYRYNLISVGRIQGPAFFPRAGFSERSQKFV